MSYKVWVSKKNAFTLIEMVVVIIMVWILIMATTIYLWWTDERRKIIEGQGCAASLWWEMANYVFYALTSKNLRDDNDEPISPSLYVIQLTWDWVAVCNSGVRNWLSGHCDKLKFLYSTWNSSFVDYKTYSVWNSCRWNNVRLSLYWDSVNVKYVVMNKWFMPTKDDANSKSKVFYLSGDGQGLYTWNIIVGLCLNSDCSTPKEISKWVVDARAQTISTRNCKFYQDEDPTRCEEREK
jgi:competence protein ComGC